MKIAESERGFGVQKGEMYFCFLVDHNSACWSSRAEQAAWFESKEKAEDALDELRFRNRIRRAERRAGNVK
jgi:hypothetical protein